MASRMLSIEIGQKVTKVCEVDEKSKNPKVYKSFMVATPSGVLNDGILQHDARQVELLRGAISANNIKAKRVAFTIASTRIATRDITIPFVKENKIAEVVNAKAEEFFPVDLSEYKVTYAVLGTTQDEKGNKRHRVMILAAPLKLLQGYYDLAAACGLEVASIDYMGNSLFQTVQNTCVEGTQMVAKIDENSTMLMIVQDGSLLSMRSVGYGVDEAIRTLAEEGFEGGYDESGYDYEDAIAALRESIYIQSANAEIENEASIVTSVTEALEYLVNGISRVIDFHNPKSNGHPIEKLYLTGLGGSFKGMSDLLEERLGVPVAVISDIDGLSLPKNFDKANLGDYIACIGASMKPLDLLMPSKKDIQQKKEVATTGAKKSDNSSLGILLGVGGVAVALVLAVVAIMPYKEAEAENRKLKAQIDALRPVEEIHNTYVATQNLWLDADAMQKYTENHNDDLVAFIKELEKKMPSDIMVLSLVANADDVTMNIQVSSKSSAAKVLRELEKFETIEVVNTNGISDVRESADVHIVSFSVYCVYSAMQEETAE